MSLKLSVIVILVFVDNCVNVAGHFPFEVNESPIQSCTTAFSLDTTTLTGIKRGDESAPCSGYLQFNRGDGNTERVCSLLLEFNKYTAQRACYTLGVNYYRDSSFSSSTRQMMLYRCFDYKEQNADIPNPKDDLVFNAYYLNYLNLFQDTGCNDYQNVDPTIYDCFDECHLGGATPFLGPEASCPIEGGIGTFWTIGCTDINECVEGVYDHCTGPFDTSCTIRKACGNNTGCSNHPGTFECHCLNGYEELHGNDYDPYDLDKGCTDIDECSLSLCDPNADCTNTPGSYFCKCNDGYTGDGHVCSKNPCDPLPNLPNAASSNLHYQPLFYGSVVMYTCSIGYNIPIQNIPYNLIDDFGFITRDSFQLTCDESGHWTPDPPPTCAPVYCGQPGMVPFAVREGPGFLYTQDVTYICQEGFRPHNSHFGLTSFKMTCQADGTWTEGTYCTDVDECADDVCDHDTETCINTLGSYLCIKKDVDECTSDVCDKDSETCVNSWGGFACIKNVPEPCDTMYSLDLCEEGKCSVKNGKASCRCDVGSKGKLCEKATDGTALTLAIVATVVSGVIFLLSITIFCCWILCPRRTKAPFNSAIPMEVPVPFYGKPAVGVNRMDRRIGHPVFSRF